MEQNASDGFHGLVGQSPDICKIRGRIEKLGHSRNAPVLVLGESGTGKEVVARSIHNANPVGAFVPIDCGALVGPLMESELFGHTRGAFTGASEAKRGLVEVADGGTAFFDEIGDLPLELQVKLLRLLQEHEYRPVGSLKQHKVDIRVIAATHHDLPRDVERGLFRLDLYYRLNIVIMRLPALRDRKEDIPLLIEHFMRRYGSRYRLTPEAEAVMLDYDWPGNVRELQNAIDRMVAINSGPVLNFVDLPSALQYRRAASEPPRAVAVAAAVGDSGTAPLVHLAPRSASLSMTDIERDTMCKALAQTRGDVAKAAVLMGIGRTTFYRKLKEYRIEN